MPAWRRMIPAMLLALTAFAASATPHLHDGNDLWVVPSESGWGISIFHQGDTLFASLFVYGQDGRARWYTASSLVGDDGGPVHDRPAVYTGALYESTGPAIGTAFDSSRVVRRQVGTMSVELGTEKLGATSPRRNYAYVTYDIDGVRIVKQAYPFSFVAAGLTGSYTGYQARGNGMKDDMTANVTLNNGAFAMSTTGIVSGSCTYSGTQDATGSLFSVDGTFSCNDGQSGNFVMTDVDVTRHGFTAKFSSNRNPAPTDMVAQRTSGAIRGDGYNTGLWWNSTESGWGLNIVEQGDVLFGTLFVYDPEGKPRWYSASNLAYEACAPADAASDCNGRYRGALYESTGPWFGTSFNAAAVQRRQVGTMTFESYGNNTAYLDYTIDGVTVQRKPLSRAAFRTNSLAGTYAGHMTAQGNNDRGVQLGAMSIDVSQSGASLTMTMRGTRGTCTMRGSASQYGRQVAASGAYDCGGATLGQMYLMDVYPTWSGFTGWFGLDGYPIGRIDAIRTTAH